MDKTVSLAQYNLGDIILFWSSSSLLFELFPADFYWYPGPRMGAQFMPLHAGWASGLFLQFQASIANLLCIPCLVTPLSIPGP